MADDALVFAGFPLRAGMGNGPRFADAAWDPGPAIHTPTAAGQTLDFGTIRDPAVRVTLKELVYHRLRWRRGTLEPIKPETAYPYFLYARRLFDEIPALAGDIASVTPDVVAPWVARLKESGTSAGVLHWLLRVLCDLHEMAEVLTYHQLPRHPLRGRSPSRVSGMKGRRGENSTPRIPEPVMGPVLAWALRYVERYADPILGAVARDRAADALSKAASVGEADAAVAAYLARLRTEGRGLPDYTLRERERLDGRPTEAPDAKPDDQAARLNWSHVAREAGVSAWHLGDDARSYNASRRRLVLDALATLGYDADRRREEDSESIEALLGHGLYGLAVRQQMGHLTIAAYVVVAFLSGMRDSEVQGITPGAVRREHSRDGRTVRWKLRAKVYKGVRGGGEVADWVVVEPVVAAVRVMERLHTIRGLAANARIFAHPMGRKAGDSVIPLFAWLDRFRDQVSDLATRSRELPPVAAHRGAPWHFTSRQFRRTLAWYIANRPFGTVAGMLQFKHASVEMYEGYAGQSASGFKLEVEQEEALRAFDECVALYDDWKRGAPVGGPGGPRLTRDFRTIRDEVGDWPGRVVDGRRLREMLRHASRHLHLGALADCRFDRERALCLRDAAAPGAPQDRPLLLMCQPSACANACVTPRHVPVWRDLADQADAYLARGGELSAPQRTIVERDRATIAGVLRPFDTPNKPEPTDAQGDAPRAT